MTIFYIDGEFVDEKNATIPVTDMVVLRGYGAFDFIRTYNRKPFRLEDHLVRFANSAKLIGLELKHSRAELTTIINETIRHNPHLAELTLRIIITGGSNRELLIPGGSGPRLLVLVDRLPVYPETWYTLGVDIVSNHVERYLPGAKSTSYLSAIVALQKAHEKKAVEAIYADRKNRVLEGTSSNIFMIKNDQLITPGDDILPGITRDVIIELTSEDYEVSIRDIYLNEFLTADEIFLSASTKEIIPVRSVDRKQIRPPCPGPHTQKITTLFHAYTRDY